ncbi:hypothetical protein HY024_02780 [Candidatus Curtissbacteria bacterium]|nr:hypothetical protein [Candidatus Curtissbacteria bacterium]
MSDRKLFTGAEVERVGPARPLGRFSDFVVDQMPGVLTRIRRGDGTVNEIAVRVEPMIRLIPRPIFINVPEERDLALLDMLMVDAAIVHSGGQTSPELVEKIEIFANRTGRIPSLTHEDFFFVNPLNEDPRTFTTGRIGRSELDFYEAHRRTENVLDEAIGASMGALDGLVTGDEERAFHLIQKVAIGLDDFVSIMVDLNHQMPTEHFHVFRQYLGVNPRGYKGASGAFTAGLPTIDLLFAGDRLFVYFD